MLNQRCGLDSMLSRMIGFDESQSVFLAGSVLIPEVLIGQMEGIRYRNGVSCLGPLC